MYAHSIAETTAQINERFLMDLTIIEMLQIAVVVTGTTVLMLMLIRNGKSKVLAMIPIMAVISYIIMRADMGADIISIVVLLICLIGLVMLLIGGNSEC